MAANRNRYEDNKLEVYKDKTTYSTLIAKMATDYTNEATIKQLFKLDYVHKVNDGQFIGGVLTSGSDNLKFHDTSNKNVDGTANSKGDAAAHQRLSHLLVRAADGNTYALFNDAGLNTKPNCWTSKFTMKDASPMLMWGGSNETRMKVAFQPARFCNTTSRKVEILNAAGTQVLATIELGTEVWDSAKTDHDIVVRISDYSDMNFVSGTKYILRVTTTNSEGSIIDTYEDYCGIDVDFPYAFDYTTDKTSNKFGNVEQSDLTEKDSFYMFNRDRQRLSQLTLEPTDYDPPIMLYTNYFMDRASVDKPNIAPAGYYSDDGTNVYEVNNNGAIVRKALLKNPISKGWQIIPYVTINNTIGIEIATQPLTTPITITSISYYADNKTTNSIGNAQVMNYALNGSVNSPIAVGKRIDTGISIAIPEGAGAARFTLSPSNYNNGIHNPQWMLNNDNWTDQGGSIGK